MARRLALRPLLALVGGVGLSLLFSGPVLAAWTIESPAITSTRSTFQVPTGSSSTWRLRLWSHGTMEGSATGTSGTLTVAVPHTSDCAFQADVTKTPLGGSPSFYSGARATMTHCGVTPPTQTIAGHIYLCSTLGAPTTTEALGGTLSATGPQIIPARANPLSPISVASGSYTMTADAPTGSVLVGCTGGATVAAGGLTASETVSTLSGGAGVGLFYASAPPTGAGGGGGTGGTSGSTGSSGSTPLAGATSSSDSPTSSGIQSNPPTAAAHSARVATVAAGSSELAFTGMDAGPPLLLGLLLVALGGLMIAGSGWRRSHIRQTVRVGPSKSSS